MSVHIGDECMNVHLLYIILYVVEVFDHIANNVIKPIKFNGSEGVLFHKDTVHFANVNKSTDCRISIEFNILAK